jgi:hypothetical protein
LSGVRSSWLTVARKSSLQPARFLRLRPRRFRRRLRLLGVDARGLGDFLGADDLALRFLPRRQVEVHRDGLVLAPLQHRDADQHRHARAVGPEKLLLERRADAIASSSSTARLSMSLYLRRGHRVPPHVAALHVLATPADDAEVLVVPVEDAAVDRGEDDADEVGVDQPAEAALAGAQGIGADAQALCGGLGAPDATRPVPRSGRRE